MDAIFLLAVGISVRIENLINYCTDLHVVFFGKEVKDFNGGVLDSERYWRSRGFSLA